jgi:alpha-L-rhamnosidase
VARGAARERFEPRFTAHGFRYAAVTGDGADALESNDVRARVVHTDLPRTGSFACSNDDLNAVQHAAEWSLRGNARGVPTDCPQRDERFGWTGDGHLSANAFAFNFDALRFHRKWLTDHADEQARLGRRGYVADTIPHGYWGAPGDPTWTVTQVLLAWWVYRHYGDERVLSRNYEAMRRYVDYWAAVAADGDGIVPADYAHFGDWLAFEHTDDVDDRRGRPFELFTTAYHYLAVDTFADVAATVGTDAEAARYREHAAAVATAFHERFFDPATGRYEPGTQAAQAVPLFVGLVPDERTDAVVASLRETLRTADDRLRTGFLGTRPLVHVLADHGHAELAHELVSQPERPGWVYMIRQGATTLWERWNSDESVGSGMNSFNHSPFTLVSEWFYRVLAGLDRGDVGPHGEPFRVAPTTVDGLDWVEASTETFDGELAVRWERDGDAVRLDVTVPWNGRATVDLPTDDPDGTTVTEAETDRTLVADGRPVADLPAGVRGVALDDGVTVTVAAGSYRFAVESS